MIVSSGQMDLTRTVGPIQGSQGYGIYPTFGDHWGKKTVIAAQTNTQPFYEDALYVLDSNGKLASTINLDPQCVNGHAVRLLPAEPDHAVVVCEGNHLTPGSLVKVDLPSGAILATAQTGVFPDGVTFVPPPGGF